MAAARPDPRPAAAAEDPQTGVKYFYGETTAEGWSLGQVPPEYRDLSPESIEVVRMVIE